MSEKVKSPFERPSPEDQAMFLLALETAPMSKEEIRDALRRSLEMRQLDKSARDVLEMRLQNLSDMNVDDPDLVMSGLIPKSRPSIEQMEERLTHDVDKKDFIEQGVIIPEGAKKDMDEVIRVLIKRLLEK